MGLLFDFRKTFLRRWRRVFSPGEVRSPLLGGGGALDIAIYQSKSLSDRHGNAPEKAVARYLAENLDRAGLGYEIRFGYPPRYVNTKHEEVNPTTEALQSWASHSKPYTAADANLLIYNINGGGRAFLGGNHGIGPGGNIDYVPVFQESSESDTHRNIRACLHEIGHMFSGRHSDNMFTKPSMVFNDSVLDDFEEYANRNL